jgi:hypothetical protein
VREPPTPSGRGEGRRRGERGRGSPPPSRRSQPQRTRQPPCTQPQGRGLPHAGRPRTVGTGVTRRRRRPRRPPVAGRARGRAWAVEDKASGEVGRFPPRGGEGVSRRDEQSRVGTRDEVGVRAAQDGRKAATGVGVQVHARRERDFQAVQYAKGVPRNSRFDKTVPGQRGEPRRRNGMIFDVDHSCRGGQHVATGVERGSLGRRHDEMSGERFKDRVTELPWKKSSGENDETGEKIRGSELR